ncbi:hypothetical protein DY000_02048843 [Brassica cretica]|uniref:Uncharacterized protein n=1 Tax=Brassica cretica TaxID=69181 RepID=A0ABQ7F6B0_BRACR|nr:hypothetical protein DY000_02048843 [Brassica cretica]
MKASRQNEEEGTTNRRRVNWLKMKQQQGNHAMWAKCSVRQTLGKLVLLWPLIFHCSPGDWENDYYNPIMAIHNATPEICDDMFDEDYRRKGILVYKFRPLKPEIQAQAETNSLFAEACGKETRFSRISEADRRAAIDREREESIARAHNMAMQEQWRDMHYKYPERTLKKFFTWLMKQTISSCNNAAVQRINKGLQTSSMTQLVERPKFGKRAYDRDGTRRFDWEEKDEYGVYRDDQEHARDVDGRIIRVSKDDIRSLLERALMDEHTYLCLPEHARSLTQNKLVPKIYTKDEIIEMFYGVCGAQKKNEGDFQMKFDGVNYPLNDSIRWLTTCMEEVRQDIAKIQTQRAAEATAPASIDRHHSTSIEDDLTHSNPMKSQPDSCTRVEIDQLVKGIYRTLETTEERLDRRCDDIYFPMDLTMSSLTSQIEAIQREIVEIQKYIARRPEGSASIDKRNNKSTDSHRRTSVDEATNRGRLVPKAKSDMSDTYNHGEEISAETYTTLMRHQFNLESLGDRLQKIENTTASMKDKCRRGDEAMRDFTGTWCKCG